MKARRIGLFIGKIGLLSLILLMIYGLAAGLAGLTDSASSVDPMAAFSGTILMIVMYTVALSYPINNSGWRGWRLVAGIAAAYYALAVFLPQLDAIIFLNVFVDIIDVTLVPKILVQGAIVAAIFSPIAVSIFGKMRGKDEDEFILKNNGMTSKTEWIVKLAIIALSYIVLYVAAGSFIAFQNPALSEYYGDIIQKMSSVGVWMLLLQGVRALIFAGVAFPIIKSMKGPWWKTGLAISMLFAFLMAGAMLVPNSFMPDSVRFSHFLEIFTENFIFGWIVAWLLHRSHSSVHDLLGLQSDFTNTK
jgi:hypothetical protein